MIEKIELKLPPPLLASLGATAAWRDGISAALWPQIVQNARGLPWDVIDL